MERFTARKPQTGSKPAGAPAGQQAASETFSEMANVTAAKSGIVGKLLVVSLIVVSIAITAFVGFAIIRGVDGANLVKDDQYQAVFLSDGQIYFGKLTEVGDVYAVLEDIYYLQVQQEVQPDTAAQPQTQISLAKLGNELHGPEDTMYINVDQILFWENLKTDGQVTEAITRYQNGEQAPVNNGGDNQNNESSNNNNSGNNNNTSNDDN